MPSLVAEGIKDENLIVTVTAGSNAILNCTSNDHDHNFMMWLLNKTKVISPGSNYDVKKYKYEVLSGRLHINNVSPAETGYYTCVSKALDGAKFAVNEVQMLVSGSSFSSIDIVKFVAVIISLVVIISSAVLYYQLKKDWKKYDERSFTPVEDMEDDEVDGDEIYNATTTNINQAVPGPSRNQSSELLYGIDNQGLDTDFNSVFENIQIKSPHEDLI